jgi:hypothetical protein
MNIEKHYDRAAQCRYAFLVEKACMIYTNAENTTTDAAQCRYAFLVEKHA